MRNNFRQRESGSGMPVETWLPTAFLVQYILAGTVYLSKGDLRHGFYWYAAAVLTACVTF